MKMKPKDYVFLCATTVIIVLVYANTLRAIGVSEEERQRHENLVISDNIEYQRTISKLMRINLKLLKDKQKLLQEMVAEQRTLEDDPSLRIPREDLECVYSNGFLVGEDSHIACPSKLGGL